MKVNIIKFSSLIIHNPKNRMTFLILNPSVRDLKVFDYFNFLSQESYKGTSRKVINYNYDILLTTYVLCAH